MSNPLVPALDPSGLPAPPWVFHLLLVLTFFLHLLFMNLTLGGTLLAWVSHLKAGGRSDNAHGWLSRRLMQINVVGISLTITTGIAPLLFIQTLYQQYFYSGTILLGWIWFALLVLLVGGYYATYVYKFRGVPTRGSGGGFWLGLAAVAFVAIAMIQVAVHLIHVQPEQWPTFAASPWAVLGDPTYWPRLFHYLLAAVAFSAVVVAWWSARQAASGKDAAMNSAVARLCWRWAMATIALQIVDGFLLLMALPREVLRAFMRGGAPTMVPLALGILLGVGLLMMLARPIDPIAKRKLITGTLASLVLTIAVMAITRDQVRALYLEPSTESFHPTVVPQWGNFVLFVVLLIAALGTVAYMTKRALAERATGDDAA